MAEVTKEVTVVNKLGIHARPAAAIVQRAVAFEAEVYFNFEGHRVNAKSIMGLLTLAAMQGSRIEIMCNGEDAADALHAMEVLFANGFGES